MLSASDMLLLLTISLLTIFMLQNCLPISTAFVGKILEAGAAPFHKICLGLSPASNLQEFYQAMVCGAPLKEAVSKHAFAQTGLLHIMVVSGSHLNVLEALCLRLTRKLRGGEIMIAFVLFVFVLATNAQPPVTRAFFFWILRATSRGFQLRWSTVQTLTLSVALTLPFCTSQQDLNSLGLSWLASLAIQGFAACFTPAQNRREGLSVGQRLRWWIWTSLRLQIIVYLVLTPVLLPLSVPHVSSIASNILLGPLLGEILFPVSMMAFVWPWFVHVSDPFWRLCLGLVEWVASCTPAGLEKVRVPMTIVLLYIFCLTLFCLVNDRVSRELRLGEKR